MDSSPRSIQSSGEIKAAPVTEHLHRAQCFPHLRANIDNRPAGQLLGCPSQSKESRLTEVESLVGAPRLESEPRSLWCLKPRPFPRLPEVVPDRGLRGKPCTGTHVLWPGLACSLGRSWASERKNPVTTSDISGSPFRAIISFFQPTFPACLPAPDLCPLQGGSLPFYGPGPREVQGVVRNHPASKEGT